MTVWGNGSTRRPTVSKGGSYGDPRGPSRRHKGTDFVGYSELRAIDGGKVTLAGRLNKDAGQTIAIDLDGKVGGAIVTIVRMHVKDGSIKVKEGSRVKAGQILGTMGSTGNAEGSCDHVEVRFWRNGVAKTVNPVEWIAQRMDSPATASTFAMAINERIAIAPANARSRPTTESQLLHTLDEGTVGTFDGFTHGQSVEGNDIWFRGFFTKRWYWSGGFGSHSTAGLKQF